MAGCSHRLPGVGQSNRPPTVNRSKRSPVARATSAVGRSGSGRVSASRVTTHCDLAASMPCWSAHALPAHPSARTCPVMTVAPAARASVAVASVDWSSTTITSWTPGAPTIASSSGPIRAASSRAGITTLMLWIGVIDGRTAGATRAAFTRRVNAMPPATTRRAIDRLRTIRRDVAHQRSCSIISATILALVVTSGSPPPGWLDPPTR